MAITQNPIIGRASGRFGTAVFTTLFGQNILKTLPVQVRDPNSPAQQLVREKFLVAATFCKLIYGWFVLAFPSSVMGMSSFASLLKSAVAATSGSLGSVVINMKTALDGIKAANTNSLCTVSEASNSLTWAGAIGWLKNAFDTGDIIDLLFINTVTHDVVITTTTVAANGSATKTVTIPYTTATDDYAVWASPRRYSKFKAQADVSGTL